MTRGADQALRRAGHDRGFGRRPRLDLPPSDAPVFNLVSLPEADDRILATAVHASWRHASDTGDWATSYRDCREDLVRAFVRTYSRSLQQTLQAMGRAVLYGKRNIAEVRFQPRFVQIYEEIWNDLRDEVLVSYERSKRAAVAP